MYRVNDKVIFHVGWMRMPVVGYIEQINGSQVHCRLSVPMMGRTHENVRIDTLKPTEEMKKQRDEAQENVRFLTPPSDFQPIGGVQWDDMTLQEKKQYMELSQ